MDNLNPTPAVEQGEPVSFQAAAPSVSATDATHVEAVEIPQPAASTFENVRIIKRISESLAGAEAQPRDPSSVIAYNPETLKLLRTTLENPKMVSHLATEGLAVNHAALSEAIGQAHEHELERMLGEGGLCPEKASVQVFAEGGAVDQAATESANRKLDEIACIADHPFRSTPTLEDPLAQECDVPRCQFSELGHPPGSQFSGPAAISGAAPARGLIEFYKLVPGTHAPSLAERVARLESEVADLRVITRHHGLRGPQA